MATAEKTAAPAAAAAPAPADSCDSCRFWVERAHLPGGKGECHRYPPVSGGVSLPPSFSMTRASDWCGEHKPA